MRSLNTLKRGRSSVLSMLARVRNADSFKSAKGESHKAWEQTRRDRISRPSSISVDIANPKVTLEGTGKAKVSFKQSYRADGKPIRTDKTLSMKKVGGVWLIDQEIASN